MCPTSVPFTIASVGKFDFHVNTSIGRALHTYDLSRGLNLIFITRPLTPHDITASVAWKNQLYAAWYDHHVTERAGIWIYQRGKRVGELPLPEDVQEPIQSVVPLGSWLVACCITRVEVWNSATNEHRVSLHRPQNTAAGSRGFFTGVACSLPTYLNKIFLGTEDGSIEVYNVSTGRLVHTIFSASPNTGSVTALEPAPALNLLAIAYEDGSLCIYDVRHDRVLLQLCEGSTDATPITSMSFRSDGRGAGDDGLRAGMIATASSISTDVTVWDLNDGGRILGLLRMAHDYLYVDSRSPPRGINKIEFLTGQPVLVSCGYDNSLRTWIFDENPYSAIPRSLHTRKGHSQPATSLRFVTENIDGSDSLGKWLLSSGHDQSLWAWSLRKDAQSAEMSQGSLRRSGIISSSKPSHAGQSNPSLAQDRLRMSEITCMAVALNRDGGFGTAAGIKSKIWTNPLKANGTSSTAREPSIGVGQLTSWESVVTGHRDDMYARTWFWGRRRAGRWALPTSDRSSVSSVTITTCGSFAAIGSSLGGIDVYNLQSGQHRGSFPSATSSKNERVSTYKLRHRSSVTGLVVNSMNTLLVSCDRVGFLKFWDFKTGKLILESDYTFTQGFTGSKFFRSNQLLGLACADSCIRVIDIETKRLVREFNPVESSIKDFCFSNDGRWIIAAAGDSTVRVWDLPTGNLIDRFRLEEPATALSFSDTGEFLATATGASLGIQLWSNRALFSNIQLHQIPEVEPSTYLKTGGEAEVAGDLQALGSLSQLAEDMITLSILPRSRWQTLLDLDLIRQRNRPKEPPKKPEKAPFFLPSLLEPSTTVSKALNPNGNALVDLQPRSRFSTDGMLYARQDLSKTLVEDSKCDDFSSALNYLKSLPPSAADTEIRNIEVISPYTELTLFVRALCWQLSQRKDFELTQAWMSVLLKIHGRSIQALERPPTGDPDAERSEAGEHTEGYEGLILQLSAWKSLHQTEAARVKGLASFSSGILGFIQSSR